jgi:hypothetical protein
MVKKKILLFQQRDWALKFGHPLAKKLYEKGYKLSALTFKKTTHEFIKNQNEVEYEHLYSHDEILENPKKFLGNERFSFSKIEEDLNHKEIWKLVQSSRFLTKSYQKKFYYSYQQNLSDETIKLYVQAIYKMCRDLYINFRPDIIFAPNFVSFPHIFFNIYFKNKKIKMLATSDTKIGDSFYITRSFLEDDSFFIDKFNKNKNKQIIENKKNVKQFIDEFLKKKTDPIIKKIYFKVLLKNFAKLLFNLIKRIYKKNPNKINNIGPTLDDRSMKILIRDFFFNYYFQIKTNKFNYDDFSKISNFAYLPLQFQPEESIDVQAPRFNNMLELARQVAMSLPGDMTLVVKDHPAMFGLRNPKYLNKIKNLPNVKIIHYSVNPNEILKKTKVVIASTGTILFEAAIRRKPAIQMGGIIKTSMLPNVSLCKNYEELSNIISIKLEENLNDLKYDFELENYISSMFKSSFDANYLGVWERNQTGDINKITDFFVSTIENEL